MCAVQFRILLALCCVSGVVLPSDMPEVDGVNGSIVCRLEWEESQAYEWALASSGGRALMLGRKELVPERGGLLTSAYGKCVHWLFSLTACAMTLAAQGLDEHVSVMHPCSVLR